MWQKKRLNAANTEDLPHYNAEDVGSSNVRMIIDRGADDPDCGFRSYVGEATLHI